MIDPFEILCWPARFTITDRLENTIYDSKTEAPVTLACIDCVNPQLAVQALRVSTRGFEPERVVLFTHEDVDCEFEVVKIKKLDFIGYQLFTLKELHKYIETSHVLTIQTDGFILRPELWDSNWLNYDYIGAPWPDCEYTKHSRVGNSGFCLRSKRFLEATDELSTKTTLRNVQTRYGLLDDHFVANTIYTPLINRGIVFAPLDEAAKFSFELDTEVSPGIDHTFGYHGKWHTPTQWLQKQAKEVIQIHIAVNYYKVDDQVRQQELDLCLLNNCKVGRVIVLTDDGIELPEGFNGHILRVPGRATFYQLFDAINHQPGVKIVINSDCWLDETVNVLKEVKKDQFICLTRHEKENGVWRLWEEGGHYSQDAWCWRDSVNFDPTDMVIGTIGCDNRLAAIANSATYTVLNPSRTVIVHHEHSQPQRSNTERVMGKYLFVYPHAWGEDAVRKEGYPDNNMPKQAYRLEGKEYVCRK